MSRARMKDRRHCLIIIQKKKLTISRPFIPNILSHISSLSHPKDEYTEIVQDFDEPMENHAVSIWRHQVGCVLLSLIRVCDTHNRTMVCNNTAHSW